ncbi:triose-phosphate isomerase [Intestinimonas butyriciproducens]|nr:triose-phosphate isomerase [Intestinimonas butyriciproducens]
MAASRGEDGGLIGGASLKPEQFVEIINAANQED